MLKKGFTITELLIVIVVIGVVSSIVLVSYFGFSSRAIEASIKADLHNAANIIKMDYTVEGAYPSSIESTNFGKGLDFGDSILDYFPSPYGFCLTMQRNGVVYRVTNDSDPRVGDCSDYGLVLYLDAGNTESYPGTGNIWYDLSGFSRNGTIYNGAVYSSDGGGSFVFDGLNDYVDLSSPSNRWAWTPGDNAGLKSASFEVWVKTSDTSGRIFSKPWNGAGEYNYGATPGGWSSVIGSQINTLSFSSVANGQWRHLVYLIDSIKKWVYMDGVLVVGPTNHNITNTVPDRGDSSLPLTLMTLFPYGGASYWEYPTHAINGSLSYVKIYDRLLTSEEIATKYNTTKLRYGY